MSAPAIKPSMPGVGSTTNSAGHASNILPLSVVSQKTVQPSEAAGGVKSMPASNMSYVTLQPSSQPLSLIQEHKNSSYQSQTPNNIPEQHKDSEQKLVQNGTEQLKSEKDKDLTLVPPTGIQNSVSINVPTPPITIPTVPSSTGSHANNPPQTSPNAPPATIPVVPTKPAIESSKSSGVEATPQEKVDSPQKSKEGSNQVQVDAQASIAQSKPEDKKVSATSGVGNKETESLPASQKTPKVEEVSVKRKEITPQKTAKSQAAKNIAENVEKSEAVKETKAPVQTPARATKKKPSVVKEKKEAFTPEGGLKPRRNRVPTTPYQSPLPEMTQIVKNLAKPETPVRSAKSDDKLIVFYKNEFLAVRNTEGSFYVCQSMQNIYKTSKKIRIRWLSQDKNNGEIYSPDFYDNTDFDCILTNLNLNKVEKNRYQLTKYELLRTENILKRAIDVEAGLSEKPSVTEEHPDGLDLSLYKDEAQLKKSSKKGSPKQKRQRRKSQKESSSDEDEESEDSDDDNDSRKGKQIMSSIRSPPKGPSRAERALNRSKALDGTASVPSTSSAPSTSTAGPSRKRAAPETKKPEPKKPALITPAAKTPVTASAPTAGSSTSSTAQPKVTKPRSQETTVSTPASGRPKRTATTASNNNTSPTTSEENTNARVKPRGRA